MASANQSNHFNFDDLGYGVELQSADRDAETVFMQGDDAYSFLEEVEALGSVWEKGNPNPDCFDSYEDHLDVIISQYF